MGGPKEPQKEAKHRSEKASKKGCDKERNEKGLAKARSSISYICLVRPAECAGARERKFKHEGVSSARFAPGQAGGGGFKRSAHSARPLSGAFV